MFKGVYLENTNYYDNTPSIVDIVRTISKGDVENYTNQVTEFVGENSGDFSLDRILSIFN